MVEHRLDTKDDSDLFSYHISILHSLVQGWACPSYSEFLVQGMLDRHHCTTIFHLYDYIWFGLYHHRVLQVAFRRSFPRHSEDRRPIVRPCWRNSPRNHVRLMVLQNPYICILDRWLDTWLPFLLSMLNPYIWHCRECREHFYISKRTFLEDYLYKPNLHLNKNFWVYKLG